MGKKAAYLGVFTALAMIFSYLESFIPIPIGIPGIKLGLANLLIVVALYKIGTREAFAISVIRIVLSGFIFSNLFSIIYSLAGGIFSFVVMYLLKKRGTFSIYGISLAGGVFHNIGQLIVAMIVVETVSIVYYAPALMVAGIVTGLIIGAGSNEILKRIGSIEVRI